MRQKDRLKPPPLAPGDTVAIVAPAGPFQRDRFEAGCLTLRRLGYEPVFLPSVFERDLYFAGSDDRRARELMAMFERDDVRAIFAARGGYGSARLLPLLDVASIRRHPKIFMGYSDNTALLSWLADEVGLVVFHGPMAAADLSSGGRFDEGSFLAAVTGAEWEASSTSGLTPLLEGEGEGMLYGGCLSMLVASLGTRYEIQTEGTLLFLEDVNVRPYEVDRMLWQMRMAGKLKGVSGIIFGEMPDCVPPPDQDYSLHDVLRRSLADLKIPVAVGLHAGHVPRGNLTLPLGVRARLQVSDQPFLRLLEPAVAPVTAGVRPAKP